MALKAAEVYFRDSDVFFIPLSRTPEGIWTWSNPATRVSREKRAALGEAAVAALESSRRDVPAPEDLRKAATAVVKPFGFKSGAALARGARLVVLDYDGGVVSVIPTKSARGGVIHNVKEAVLSELDPSPLATALLQVVNRSM